MRVVEGGEWARERRDLVIVDDLEVMVVVVVVVGFLRL